MSDFSSALAAVHAAHLSNRGNVCSVFVRDDDSRGFVGLLLADSMAAAQESQDPFHVDRNGDRRAANTECRGWGIADTIGGDISLRHVALGDFMSNADIDAMSLAVEALDWTNCQRNGGCSGCNYGAADH